MKIFAIFLVFSLACCEESGPVIGIDLGTSYSCVAVYLNNRVEIIANELGSRTTPSWVAFTDMDRLVGEAAKTQVSVNPTNTIYDIKRLLGRKWDDPEVQRDMKLFPFKVVNGGGKPLIAVLVKGEVKRFAPEEISAMILGKMKFVAEEYLGRSVKSAIVTCPAHFNNAQRQATKDAGMIAGLNVIRVLSEGTAAAVAFYVDKKNKGVKNIIVYDLGSGMLDVSLVHCDDGVVEVLSTSGDIHLGGEDFDQNVVDHLVEIWKHKTGHDISKNKRAMQKLRREVEKAKCALSTSLQVVIEIDNFCEGIDFHETLTRDRFNLQNAALFERTLKPLEQVLDYSRLEKSDIDDVVMVGGSSRIPKIRQLVKDFFNGKELSHGINPDEAVAYGAAVQGAILSDDKDYTMREDMLIMDRTSLPLGIQTRRGVLLPVVERPTIIPCKITKIFPSKGLPYNDVNQPNVLIKMFEGEYKDVKNDHELGSLLLSSISSSNSSNPHIEVTFEIDLGDVIKVTAMDQDTKKKEFVTITRDKDGLSEDDIRRMQEEAVRYREDEEIKKEIEKQNKYQCYASNLERMKKMVKPTENKKRGSQ